MKAKFNFIFTIIVCLSMGCEDNLDRFPLDAPSDVNFFRTEGELELAINGVYNNLWWHVSNHQALQSLDNTTDIGFLRDGPIRDLANGSTTTTSQGIEAFWTHLYHGISRANNILSNMHKSQDQVSDDFLIRIEAEAKFLRSYFYHFLLEMHGDVPLLSEIPSLEESNISRSPKSEVVDFIISDLEYAADKLPLSWQGNEEGRATKGAALALIARVALYNGEYDLAIQASQEVMDLNAYLLYPNYEELFQYEGIRNSEVILDVPYLQGIRVHEYPQRAGSRLIGSFSSIVPSQFMVDSYLVSDGLPVDKSPRYNPSQPFMNRDPRLYASIVIPQSELAGFIFETHPDSIQTWRVENGIKTVRVANQDVTNPFATFTGYLWRKYSSPIDYPLRNRASELNFILIRYAEVLLINAEAKIELNNIDQSVLDAMNKVRSRAYGVDFTQTDGYPEITTTDQSELRMILRNERKVELANEGFRLFDIRRWGIADIVMNGPLIGRPHGSYEDVPNPPTINLHSGHPEYGANLHLYRQVIQRSFRSRDWLYPIPQSEINVNENITQNPGY
jgi:hypothetical protein